MEQIVWGDLEATFARLEAEAAAVLAATLPNHPTSSVQRFADIRFVGQASELVVPLPPGPYTADSRGALVQAFEASYIAAFTRTPPTTQVEIINVRVSASVEVEGAALSAARPETAARAIKGQRPVYFPELRDHVPCPIYDRGRLPVGARVTGPAVVEEAESTTVLPPGTTAEVDPWANLIVTWDEGARP